MIHNTLNLPSRLHFFSLEVKLMNLQELITAASNIVIQQVELAHQQNSKSINFGHNEFTDDFVNSKTANGMLKNIQKRLSAQGIQTEVKFGKVTDTQHQIEVNILQH